MPAGDTEPVLLEHHCELDQRFQLGALRFGDPAAQVLLGLGRIVELVEGVEPERMLVRADDVQRLLKQLIEPVVLLRGQVRGPLEPQISRVLQQPLVLLGLRPANLIERL